MKEYSCGSLRSSDEGKRLSVAGWVHAIQDHGNTFFIDLRDLEG